MKKDLFFETFTILKNGNHIDITVNNNDKNDIIKKTVILDYPNDEYKNLNFICSCIEQLKNLVKEHYDIDIRFSEFNIYHVKDNIFLGALNSCVVFYEPEYYCKKCEEYFLKDDLKRGDCCPCCNNKNLEIYEVSFVKNKKYIKR